MWNNPVLPMKELLKELDLDPKNISGTFSGTWTQDKKCSWLSSKSPIDDSEIAQVSVTTEKEYEEVLKTASETFERWRIHPAPKRGEVVREIANEYRRLKEPLGKLVSLERVKSSQKEKAKSKKQ